MERDILEQFRALRSEAQLLRSEVRDEIKGLYAKLDEHLAAIQARCARRGEEIAVLRNHDRERERRIDRRVALGVLLLAALSLLMKVLL